MESVRENIEQIVSGIGDVAETKLELLKLRTAGKASEMISSVVAFLALVLITGITLIIISIGAAYWIGNQFNNTSYGFFIVGGFYILLFLFILLLRKNLISKPFYSFLINKMLK